ncbi:MAG: hypothetical protein EOO07_00225 [Chitinophagaceae bacterium]|nr:MAG: hypothetical protein EOO07_00225 [Chitinophagaceae bacterium]
MQYVCDGNASYQIHHKFTSTIMETIVKQTQANEEILLSVIEDFFDCRQLPQHLLFLDYWMEKVLVNYSHKKYLSPQDLVFFSEKFTTLLAACHSVYHSLAADPPHFEESIKIPENFISAEQKSILFHPNYLRKKEICNPLRAFKAIFKLFSLDYYTHTIQNWVNESLPTDSAPENVRLIFPAYKNLKRLVEACWLIHERSISKNSFQLVSTAANCADFSLSCPLLLTDEYLDNPYLFVETFFSFTGINEYKEDLTHWIKAAINEHQRYENASDLLFIYHQFTQLLHAGYLIGSAGFSYVPARNYSMQYDTFGHWLLARMGNQFTVYALSPHFRQNPLAYCSEHLTLAHVIKLRFGLKEWLEAALSESTSITSLDHTFIFDQLEELQRILEALFLLIVEPALVD